MKKNVYVSKQKRKKDVVEAGVDVEAEAEAEEEAEAETETEVDPNLPVIKFEMTNENGTKIQPPAPVGIGKFEKGNLLIMMITEAW